MAELRVTVELIDMIRKHPNADRLDLVTVNGWQSVVSKDELNVSDKVVYIPIDSVLPEKLERLIFSNSKIKLNNSRVRTIKIRGAISQGLVIPFDKLSKHYKLPNKVGSLVNKELGIIKYESKGKIPNRLNVSRQKPTKKNLNPNFKKYTNLNHYRNFKKVFESDELVIVTEKIHGTNYRVGYVPYETNTFFGRIFANIRKFIGLNNQQFVYGSHNVQLQRKNKKTFYSNNVYKEITERYDFENLLDPGIVVYGEIYGPGIQKGYGYGLNKDEIDLVVFDVMKDGKYMDDTEMLRYCAERNLKTAPQLFCGYFKDCNLDELCQGRSVFNPKQKIREGCVIKPVRETQDYMGRKVFKIISPEYLLRKNNTDWH